MLFGMSHTTYFLLVFQGGIPALDSHGSRPLCPYILYSLHMLPLSPWLSILSLAKVCLWGIYFFLHNISVSFSMWDVPVFSFAVPLIDQPHVASVYFFSSAFLLLYLGIPICGAQYPNI